MRAPVDLCENTFRYDNNVPSKEYTHIEEHNFFFQFCWTLPYYGSAFFHGQIETPARSLTSLVINNDTEIIVAINPNGLYVIDPINVVSTFVVD